MCRLLNKKHDDCNNAIYIGRGSKWGNPFKIGPDGDRESVIVRHTMWFFTQHDLMYAVEELRGHDLVCYCNPLPCHGDLLLWLANMSIEDRHKLYEEFGLTF